MKILFLSHSFYPNVGGIETSSLILAQDYVKAGHEVHLLTWSLVDLEVEVPFSFLLIRNPSKIVLIREHYWADLIFENNPCLQLAWPKIFFNRTSVIVLQTWLTRINGKIGWQDNLKLWWLKRADLVIACSEVIRKRCWLDAIVIHNSYQDNVFKVINTYNRTGRFVFLGRLVSDKGVDLAIKAFHQLINSPASLKEIYSNVCFTIVGEGAERNNLEKLVEKLNLSDYINFVGTLTGEQLVDCLNRHQYILVPSAWEEPFGIVALEGMACGCIPIVSNGGGLSEAVGKAGLVFKRGDINSLVDSIRQIFENPELEQQLREAAPVQLLAHQQHKISKRYLASLEVLTK